ncbi:MAG: 1-(5-phosphoribosyl)-5-[(5-phosphoribosylamino)methylideneamino]imidazole-4-carboxamide isomerase [Phycisphaerae bacterium]|nr:1-(5-phosphoribosyl)-5-[(5-phosphoribosylamino)methylideneamino]imidazole-4-carboxamide isomerase [Phycisphaerae bacterium]
MDILPAIDLRGGEVVRLQRGDYDRQTTYADDPVGVARSFVEAGAKWIHIVDLDAALSGTPENHPQIRAIREAVGVKIELGGGARTTETIAAMHAELADRVVIGSAALEDWAWFEGLLNDETISNERLALGLDARDGKLAIHGWTEQLAETAVDLAGRVRGSGLGAIVYTDIARDGMLTGVNVQATAEIVEATDVPVVASGGVSSLDDIRQCRQIGCGGVILGKALYEGQVDLAQAVAASMG